MSNLPSLFTPDLRTPDDWRARRRELIEILSREEYGFTPPAPASVRANVVSSERVCAGKGVQTRVELSFDTPMGEYTFPFNLVLPVSDAPAPAFVALCFRPEIPDKYLPMEEILDHGFAVASLFYKDVTADGPELDGIAAMYPIDAATGWGKLGMWAFAASRVMDYLETLDAIDHRRVCVIGHSRLGKTALWCGAQDERFSMAVSNDSGCSGAAISRNKVGETIADITRRFPYWFCPNYWTYANREAETPFEQHMLIAAIAPRPVLVGSASEDEWADPASEFLACTAASPAWEKLGLPGFIAPDTLPAIGDCRFEGSIGYHLREGKHFFSEEDWQRLMRFVAMKLA